MMNNNEEFERLAEEFFRETGQVAPGKDIAAAFGQFSFTDRLTLWDKWRRERHTPDAPGDSESDS